MKKNILASLLLILVLGVSFAQQPKYQLSSHILDISKGLPATDVKISLQKQIENNEWLLVAEKVTDENGRVPNSCPKKREKTISVCIN